MKRGGKIIFETKSMLYFDPKLGAYSLFNLGQFASALWASAPPAAELADYPMLHNVVMRIMEINYTAEINNSSY